MKVKRISPVLDAVQITDEWFRRNSTQRPKGAVVDRKENRIEIILSCGLIYAFAGDWIIKDGNGNTELCRADDFKNLYEEVHPTYPVQSTVQ